MANERDAATEIVGDDADRLPVTVAAGHRSFYADQALSLFLGRDCELVFISVSQSVVAVQQEGGTDKERLQFNLQGSMKEVARVRFPPEAAVSLSMSFIERLLKAGLIDPEGLRKSVDGMLASGPDDSDIGDTHE